MSWAALDLRNMQAGIGNTNKSCLILPYRFKLAPWEPTVFLESALLRFQPLKPLS